MEEKNVIEQVVTTALPVDERLRVQKIRLCPDGVGKDAPRISVVTGNKIVGSDVDLWARPAVSLKSSTQITGGDGTISNPYEIS